LWQKIAAGIDNPEERPHTVSVPCWDLLCSLLHKDAAVRLKLEGALEHPWVAPLPPPADAAAHNVQLQTSEQLEVVLSQLDSLVAAAGNA
jgi:hypothetical protein